MTFHSTSQANANQIIDFFKENWKNFKIVMLTESVSNRMHVRMNLIQQSDCVLVITTCNFQKNYNCIEIVHYARSINKKLYGINFSYGFKPFGALGFILGNETELVQLRMDDAKLFNESLDKLAHLMNSDKTSDADASESLMNFTDRNVITPIASLKYQENSSCSVLISCHEETLEVAQIIADSLKYKDISYLIEDSSMGVSSIQKCKIVILVLSSGYERNLICRSLIDTSRNLNKNLVLVIGEKDWRPFSWIKILISGRECFKIFNKEQAYEKKFNDSTEIEDLTTSVIHILYPKTTSDYKEYDLTFILKKNIENCKSKLSAWPPPKRHQQRQKTLEESVKNIQLNKEEALRIKSAQSLGLRDIFSIYSNRMYDCVLLYEKNALELVMKVNQELKSRQIRTWLDLNFSKGYEMFSTSYEKISNAIESSKVVIVVLNDSFQTSNAKRSEFEYAIKRNKAFIFLIVQEGLIVENWIEPYLNESPKYEFFIQASNEKSDDISKSVYDNMNQVSATIDTARKKSSQVDNQSIKSAKSDWGGDLSNF